MPEPQTRTAPGRTDLFDRYALPKVALAVILAASLVGTWVTTTLSGPENAVLAVARWAYFVAMGVLTGGLVWKHLFVRPADLDEGAADFCAEMYDRFDRIAAGSIAVLAVGGAVVVRACRAAFGPAAAVLGYGALVGVWIAVAVVTTRRNDAVERGFRSPAGLAALALAVVVVAATAVAEVAARGLDPVATGVRALHLLAFAVWIGGAVWNIFVAVPTGQRRPTTPVVRAAGEQLERFRWAVRFIIPTLFLTGLYQAADGLGTTIGWYLGSAVGLAVIAKVGFVALLVVIFNLCPMWRACSPVEGVCELDDLGRSGSEVSDDDFR
jgi:putative copper resistance protein D